MRQNLAPVWNENTTSRHPGLSYEIACVERGKVPDDKRTDWLETISKTLVPDGYQHAYALWVDALARCNARSAEVETASRLLIGHGNPSAIDVGLTLQTTWGVPVIPGTALKGLLNHYVGTTLGPVSSARSTHPMDPSAPEALKARMKWQGVTWQERRIVQGPGELHRALFGAPPSDSDEEWREKTGEDGKIIGEYQGLVAFHDAWMIPPLKPEATFLATDVLTVHHKGYYNAQGRDGGPNDYDEPNPVSFLSVRPGVSFLIAISGPTEWTELTMALLQEALLAWGIGGKTAAGYGRIKDGVWSVLHGPDRNEKLLAESAQRRERTRVEAEKRAQEEAKRRAEYETVALKQAEEERQRAAAEAAAERRRAVASTALVVEFEAFLKAEGLIAKDKIAKIGAEWLDRIKGAPSEQQNLLVQRIRSKFDKKNVIAARDALLKKIEEK